MGDETLFRPKRPWRKNLYENADYEDNYTDSSFLKDLRTNLYVKMYTYSEAIGGITLLNNQVSCITGFLIIFYMLYSEKVTPTTVLLSTAIVTAIGYMIYRGGQLNTKYLIDDSKTLLTVLLFGYIFAPMLHTLTDAISTDTIFMTTFFMMVLNLVFFDYGLPVAMVSKAVSVNAAIFGSICLASRLPSTYHAFVLLVESAIFFVLYPILTTKYWNSYFLVPIFSLWCFFLYYISITVLSIYIVGSIFINFVCPWIFVEQQKHKNNIHGPWDEAIVEENSDLNIDEKL